MILISSVNYLLNLSLVQINDNIYRIAALTGRIGLIFKRAGLLITKARSLAHIYTGTWFANRKMKLQTDFIISRHLVIGMYAVAFYYIAIDTGYKAFKIRKKGWKAIGFSCFDTLTWHALASVAFPTIVLEAVVIVSHGILSVGGKIQSRYIVGLPIILGLVTLPFIIDPIDNLTSYLMNKSIRKGYIDILEPENFRRL